MVLNQCNDDLQPYTFCSIVRKSDYCTDTRPVTLQACSQYFLSEKLLLCTQLGLTFVWVTKVGLIFISEENELLFVYTLYELRSQFAKLPETECKILGFSKQTSSIVQSYQTILLHN